ncbi:MAG: SH3 domain-containing protein [Candidatus Thiodiazotropha sp. (ex Ustalcina ferruginea)]|nr:SH3 domain-containing protein [Candidatus Thiodiazotropha sp. (ex Ustalcina ferruginea)]
MINSKGKLLKRLNSGTELELLEEKGLFAKVRTKDGTEGWTKAGFLITRKPARAQLLEMQQQNLVLTSKLGQSETALTQAKNHQLANIKNKRMPNCKVN